MDRWQRDDYFGLVCPDCGRPPLNCLCDSLAHLKKLADEAAKLEELFKILMGLLHKDKE